MGKVHVDCVLFSPEESADEMLKFSRRMGWDSLCMLYPSWEYLKLETEEQRIFAGIEISPQSPIALKKVLGRLKRRLNRNIMVVVNTPHYPVIRAACEDDRVDAVLLPYAERNDPGIDIYCARKAAENGVLMCIGIREILSSHGWRRVEYIKNITDAVRICRKAGCRIASCSHAKSRWELRSPRDIAGLLISIGVPQDVALNATSLVSEKLKQV